MKRFYVEIFYITPAGNGIRAMFTYKSKTGEGAKKLALAKFKKQFQRTYGEKIDQDEIRRVQCGKLESGYFMERRWGNPR